MAEAQRKVEAARQKVLEARLRAEEAKRNKEQASKREEDARRKEEDARSSLENARRKGHCPGPALEIPSWQTLGGSRHDVTSEASEAENTARLVATIDKANAVNLLRLVSNKSVFWSRHREKRKIAFGRAVARAGAHGMRAPELNHSVGVTCISGSFHYYFHRRS